MKKETMENEKLKVDNSPSSSLSLSKCEGLGCETARGSANLKTNSHSVLDTESPKNVPKLRFKEFTSTSHSASSGEWVEKRLGDMTYMKAGKFVNASNISDNRKNGLYPCYGGNGLRGYTKTYTHEGQYSLIGRQGALCGNIQITDAEKVAC